MKGFLVLLLITLAIAAKVRYDGQQVIRYKIHNTTEASLLRNFVEVYHADVWAQHPGSVSGVLGEVDVRVKNQVELEALSELGLESSSFIPDLQALIDEESIRQDAAAPEFFSKYRTYQEHYAYLQELVSTYPTLASLITIGKTVEGRAIYGIVITSKVKSNKPGIFLNSGQHAREWISPATLAYIGYKLLSGYGNTTTDIVDSIEWTLIPVVNGDGYEYTFSKDRMWRKNRRVNKNSSCVGVDTNRNWGYQWKTGGSSTNPCDETFCGPNAFSEPENSALADYIKAHTNIEGYIDFHSYSQLWMTPWGYTTSLPKDYTVQKNCGSACALALKNVNKVTFAVGNVGTIIYIASGGSNDWTYGAQGIVHSYAVELRDTGAYGFLLPANQIVPSGEETFAAVAALAGCVLA